MWVEKLNVEMNQIKAGIFCLMKPKSKKTSKEIKRKRITTKYNLSRDNIDNQTFNS